MKIGDSPTSITTGAQLDIEKSGSRTVFMDTGKVGIGDVSPASLLTVGSGDLFQVDSTGNIVKINNVTTSFPGSQGSAGTILTNNGSGTLTWSAPAGISADSLNFTDLSDSLLLDASTDIFSSGTNVLSVTNSGTGLSLRVNDDGTLTDSTPFAIDASGNVGIGVAAPASKLDVAGSIRFSTTGSEKLIANNGGTSFLEYDSNGNVFLRAYDGGGTVRDIALQTGTPATTRLFVDENGLVGIGDTTPAALLTVGSGDLFQVNSSGSIAAVAGITMTSGALSIPNGDLGGGSTLRFKNASAANDAAMYETNGNILMVQAGASNSIVLRDSSGNYGANFSFTGNGSTLYNIYDDAASRGALTFYRSRSSATAPAAGFGTFLDFNLEGYTNSSQVGTSRISSLWENTQTNDTTDRDAALTFNTTLDNSSAERMRITSAGYVGIAKNNPQYALDVAGTIKTTTLLTPYQHTINVAKSGGDYTTITAAINSITDNDSTHLYTIFVQPGIYSESITTKPYIDIIGSGIDATVISGVVYPASNTLVKNVTISGTGSLSWYSPFNAMNAAASPVYIQDSKIYINSSTGPIYGFLTTNGSMIYANNVIVDITVGPNGGDSSTAIGNNGGGGVYNNMTINLTSSSGSATRDDISIITNQWNANISLSNSKVTVTNNATSNNNPDKLFNVSISSPSTVTSINNDITYTAANKSVYLARVDSASTFEIRDTKAVISVTAGSGTVYGIESNNASANLVAENNDFRISKANASNVYGIYLTSNPIARIQNNYISTSVTGSGGNAYGAYLSASSPTLSTNTISGSGGAGTSSYGVYATTATCNPIMNHNLMSGLTSDVFIDTGCVAKGSLNTFQTSTINGTFNSTSSDLLGNANISAKLGVGTTTPAGKVQVVTTSDTTPSTVTAWDARHLTVGATGSTGSGVGISYDQTNNRGYISAASPNNTWRDIIIGAGTANVGIGMTTAPAAKLTVSGGDILLDNGKKVYMASITNGAGYFFDGSSAWGLKAYNSGSNYYTDLEFDSTGGSGSNSRGIRLMDWNGSAVRLFVGDTGNVGVGNTNPGYLLHVGSTGVTDGTTVLRLEDANSTCSFTANTGAPTCGSDETLKKNITDLGGSLSKIDALRLVEYNWKTDAPGTTKQTGFVAQEVEKIFPKLVSEQKWIDGTSKKFLETAGLVPYLVGATQELSVQTKSNTAEISELKKVNADMKAEISDLKTRLESLEQKLK